MVLLDRYPFVILRFDELNVFVVCILKLLCCLIIIKVHCLSGNYDLVAILYDLFEDCIVPSNISFAIT